MRWWNQATNNALTNVERPVISTACYSSTITTTQFFCLYAYWFYRVDYCTPSQVSIVPESLQVPHNTEIVATSWSSQGWRTDTGSWALSSNYRLFSLGPWLKSFVKPCYGKYFFYCYIPDLCVTFPSSPGVALRKSHCFYFHGLSKLGK